MNRDTEQTSRIRIGRATLFRDLRDAFTGDLFQDGDVSLLGHGTHPTRKPA
jgi:hypothetical protein